MAPTRARESRPLGSEKWWEDGPPSASVVPPQKAWFPKSLLPHLKNGRYAFDPNKVMDDIADIKKRLGIGRKKR